MARKTLGYEELQWNCPNCGGNNPGPEKVCGQCGAPQPEDVVFEQVKGAKLTQDEKVAARVKAGPDIHCPYCQARNPGDAEVCSQCGGDLISGKRREAGKVLGAYKDSPVGKISCPNCGTENLETAATCIKCGASLKRAEPEPTAAPAVATQPKAPGTPKKIPVGLIIILVAFCVLAAAAIFFLTRTEAIAGTVQQVGWQRSIAIEGLVPVDYNEWRDQIPAEGDIRDCRPEVRWIESEPQPNAEEVCGTPYSVDTGSGFAEVVQDCEYHVYDDYCTYSILEWTVIDTITSSGDDFYPQWPEPALSSEQRLGKESEEYTVTFGTNQGDLVYSLSDYSAFQAFEIGSRWNLEVNSFGSVVSVAP